MLVTFFSLTLILVINGVPSTQRDKQDEQNHQGRGKSLHEKSEHN